MEIKETLTKEQKRISHIPLLNQVFSQDKTKCIKIRQLSLRCLAKNVTGNANKKRRFQMCLNDFVIG